MSTENQMKEQTPADDAVLDLATAWLAQDPDDDTRAELDTLIRDARAGSQIALDDLHDRFDTRLTFGTAGLRGRIAAGPNRMNRVVVSQAAAGLAAYLLERSPDTTPRVVIGYDGRVKSHLFATDTAELMAGAGIDAIVLPGVLPTPVLAFAVRYLGASAGVMVTASHNPAADNGYKVYLGGDDNGSQIVPPADGDIAAQINRISDSFSVRELPRSSDFTVAGDDLVDAYIAETAALATTHPGERAPLDVVYSAMHGVGWNTFSRVVTTAGFAEPVPVAEQQEPDPAFPTVTFPNPEEEGALDLSFHLARERGAELIIANDPDADRMSVAIPDDTRAEGYRQLSGNEVGWLLGWRTARMIAESELPTAGTLACTIVSSPALGAVAKHYGLDFAETLTGFKWVSRVPGLVFGYEEAIGYLVNPHIIRDKDGISAGLAFLALASEAKARGETVADLLDQFARTFGAFASDQLSIRVVDLGVIKRIMQAMRTAPPLSLGGMRVREIDDLLDGFGSLPATDALRFRLEDGSRVMVRPSGTEPKLKFYLDVTLPYDERARSAELLAAIRADLQSFAERAAEAG
ncbi:phospho-sugar mutase [Okibacterium endophyticum]